MSQLGRCGLAMRQGIKAQLRSSLQTCSAVSRAYTTQSRVAEAQAQSHSKQKELLDIWNK
ncbi:hypothetical protein E4U54_001966, partial [Claviceps lovelessii]